MKFLKIAGWVLFAWVVVVLLFESLIGYFQPADTNTLVITTTNDGDSADRVLSSIRTNDSLYVAANHWPRSWYNDALKNPQVEVQAHWDEGAASGTYMAVPVEGDEHEMVDTAQPLPLTIRILTGFPPRVFLRLDPVMK